MNKNQKKNRALVVVYIAFVVLVVLSFIFSILGIIRSKEDYSFDDKSIYDWGEGWTIKSGSHAGETVSLPAKIDVAEGEEVVLCKRLPDDMGEYNCISLESKRQKIAVSVDGQVRGSYSMGLLGGKSLPFAYVLAPLDVTDAGAEVSIAFVTDTYYSGNISSVVLGNEMSIMLGLIKSNIFELVLICIISIVGVLCLTCFLVYRRSFEDSVSFLYLFWFAFFTSLWNISQIKIRQVFIKDISLFESVGHCAFLLIPVAIILYFNGITKARHIKLCQNLALITMANFLGQNILHTTGVSDYFETQTITQIYTLFMLVIFIILCMGDLKSEKTEGLMLLNVGLISAFFGIVFEATFMSINGYYKMGTCYTVGASIFLIVNLLAVFMSNSKEQQRQKDAESANAAKSQFLATMSHEIRTPINAVLGMNEMILRDSKEDNIKDYAVNVAEAGKSLLSLVNDILDFSKIESGKMDIVCVDYHMKYLLRDLVLMIQGRVLDKNLEFKLDIDETIPAQYHGDEVRIKQIVTNILTNAAKYTEKGSITFSVKNLGIEDDEISLRFAVKDTGIGITKENIELLSSSTFVRVDELRNRNIEGTGLGLSITRRLLELMDSKLEVESTYGEGSEFYFVIKQKIVDKTPMGSIMQKDKSEIKKRRNTFTAKGAKVLAVDDTPTNLLVIKGLLKPYEMQVDTCKSGIECLEKCKEEHYDIIFMDHMMPELDGIETLKRLRKDSEALSKNSIVVALTANAVSGAETMYKENGFNGYITKPIESTELDACLKEKLPDEYIIPVSDE